MTAAKEPSVSVLLDADWANSSLVEDVRRGLSEHPRTLPPKWLYDDRGSELFDEITRLPEYYPFHAERSILEEHADAIVTASGATTLVELGSGTSEKTRLLLDAFTAAGQLTRFAPVDVSEQTLRDAADLIANRYPGVQVAAIVGDFTLHLAHLPKGGRRMIAFLGGTIGNLYLEERRAFLGALADMLDPGDSLLVGTDLVKSPDRLIAAYNDPQGVTDEFIRNSLVVLNRELGADFDLDAFAHRASYDDHAGRIDMHLVSRRAQTVRIPGAGLEVRFAARETIHTEVSYKYDAAEIEALAREAGLAIDQAWQDPERRFTDVLLRIGSR